MNVQVVSLEQNAGCADLAGHLVVVPGGIGDAEEGGRESAPHGESTTDGHCHLVWARRVFWLAPRRLLGVLLAFWVLFQQNVSWASAGFYLFGMIFGILLISQFWTLANDVYDPRQARLVRANRRIGIEMLH